MPGVVLEIDEEDVFAPVIDQLDQEECIHVPTNCALREDMVYPDPPVRDEPVLDAEHELSMETLIKMAKESHKAHLEVLEVYPVVVKHIEGCEGQCVMCLQPLMRICMKCDSRETDFRMCAVSKGQCGHAIHQHCYENYIKSSSGATNCLICRRIWVLASSHNLSSGERIK